MQCSILYFPAVMQTSQRTLPAAHHGPRASAHPATRKGHRTAKASAKVTTPHQTAKNFKQKIQQKTKKSPKHRTLCHTHNAKNTSPTRKTHTHHAKKPDLSRKKLTPATHQNAHHADKTAHHADKPPRHTDRHPYTQHTQTKKAHSFRKQARTFRNKSPAYRIIMYARAYAHANKCNVQSSMVNVQWSKVYTRAPAQK